MYHSREDFIRAVTKVAQSGEVGSNQDQIIKGQQDDAAPELLQPDEGKGVGSRGEEESFSTAMEQAHKENRQDGFLPDAFAHFRENAKQDGATMRGLLANFGADAIVSKAPLDAVQEKMSAARLNAFSDELRRLIRGSRGVSGRPVS